MLWRKSIQEAFLPMLATTILMIVFGWVFIGLQSTIDAGPMLAMLPDFLAKMIEKLTTLPPKVLASKLGQYSLLYIDATVVFTCAAWTIVRGSAVVSGEIGRGTMEMLLALPVRRATVYFVPTIVSIVGTAIIAGGLLFGVWLGLLTAGATNEVAWTRFIPGASNTFFFMYCLLGVVTFLSSFDNERWRTIGLSVAFFATSLLLKIVARLWPPGAWLKYGSMLSLHEPHRAVLLTGDELWRLALFNDGMYFLIGTFFFVLGLVIFVRRDLPAPL